MVCHLRTAIAAFWHCSFCLLSYILHTIDPGTIRLHGTRYLVYTVPFVAYGLFRFIFKVQEGKGDGPVEILTGVLTAATD